MKLVAILPTHNRPTSLRETVDSVLTQSRLPEQLIIVNDGEVEVDSGVVDDLQAAAIEVMLIRREEASSTASRNAGLDLADGEIIVLLEDDIILPPTFFAELLDLYAADDVGAVGAIGPVIREPDTETPGGRLWLRVEWLLGRGRWGPRHRANRYQSLPPSLRGRLQPVRKLSGGGLSMRGYVARTYRFDETLGGYAWGEDRELTFRMGRRYGLYRAVELRILHQRMPGGRGNWQGRGRAYVTNTLHIASRCDGGAGLWLMAGWDLAATFLQYTLWLPVARRRGEKLRFLSGMAAQLLARGRRLICE